MFLQIMEHHGLRQKALTIADTRDYKGPFSSIQKVAVANGKVFVATVEGLYYSNNKSVDNLVKATGPEELY